MRCIFHINNWSAINGTTIDSIEYWLYISENIIPIYYVSNIDVIFIERIIRSRYSEVSFDYKRYLVPINGSLPTKGVMFGSTYEKLKGRNIGFSYRCVHSQSTHNKYTDNSVFFGRYDKKMYLTKLKGRGGRECKYIHKSSFELDENSPTVKYLDDEEGDIMLYVSPKYAGFVSDRYRTHPNIRVISGGVIENFFFQFNELVYIFEGSDYSPRLFIESAFLGKKLTCLGGLPLDDGSFDRYNDALDHNFSKYLLSEDDAVVEWLVS